MTTCKIHNQPVTDFQIITSYVFVDHVQHRGMETFVLSCGCEHTGAYWSTEQVLSEDETEDGSYIVRHEIFDREDNLLLAWTVKRKLESL